jgi:hypothetical protein
MGRTVAFAIAGGVLGMLAGGWFVDLATPGPPDLTNADLLAAAYGGGIGWLLGTLASGWRRPFPQASDGWAWALRIGAAAMLLVGYQIAQSAFTSSGPQIDEWAFNNPTRVQLALLLWADAAIAAGTFLALSMRRVAAE